MAPQIGRVAAAAWISPVATAAVALSWCAVAALADPTRPGSVALPLCPFKALTGWACPVCGSTRMLHELLHGHLGSAARDNVVVLALLPVLLYGWLAWTLPRFGAGRLPTWRPSAALQRLGLGVWLAFAVLRNTPWGHGLRG